MTNALGQFKGRYRVSEKPTEILDILDSARMMGRNFIWHLLDGQRTTYNVQIVDLRVENGQTLIAIENKSEAFQIGEMLYLRMDSRDAVVKAPIVDLNDLEVVIEFPKEILLSDHRKRYRTPFSVSDHKTIRIQSGTHIEEVLCLDIHEAGMAIFQVSSPKSFELGDQVTLLALGDQALNPPLPAEIVSRVDYQVKNQINHISGHRMGIEIDGCLPRSILDPFSVREALYHLNEEQLVRDSIFRKKVHENMESTLEKLSKHKLLRKFFEHLNFDRRDNDYIKIHIRLLCEILCGLGTRLGWVSEKTMDKLVYVAFMHDVALLTHPELARIKSKRQLEALRNELGEEDIKRYLEAPLYAAELARLDPESYPDAVKILLQQRELPDGSGFPYGIGGAQLVPLSCLFIFSHYLVDNIINDPDWTIADFIKSHQWILKGTYFSKITQLLKASR